MRNYQEEVNNIRLLGVISVEDDEYNELITYARNYLLKVTNYYSTYVDLILSMALVQIAIREYKEGNFWDNFLSAIQVNKTYKNKCNIVGKIFINTLRKYNLYVYTSVNQAEYVQNILIHSMIPDYYFNQFCDFMFSFYELNLKRYFDEDLIQDELENIAFYFQRTLSDDFKNEDNANSCRGYLLLKSARVAMANIDDFLYYDFFVVMLKYIDDFFYESILPENKDRVSTNFIKWIESKTFEMDKTKRDVRKKGLYNAKPYYRIDFSSKSFSLVIPEQKIRENEYDNKGIFFNDKFNEYKLYANGTGINIIYTDEKIIKNYSISPFDETKWTITSKETKNYYQEKTSFLFFDEEGICVNKLKNGKNYIVINDGVDYIIGDSTKIIENNNFKIAGFRCIVANVNDDFFMIIDGERIGKTGVFHEILIAKEHNNIKLEDLELGNSIKVLKEQPIISFVIKLENIKGTIIRIKDKTYRLIDFTSLEKVVLSDSEVGITLDLSEINFDDGYYQIIIDEPNMSNRIFANYYLLRNFKINFTKKRFIFDDVFVFIDASCKIEPENSAQNEFGAYILRKSEVDYKFIFDFNFRMSIPSPIFKWRLVDEKWNTITKTIWYTDLTSIIEVSLPNAEYVQLVISNNRQKKFIVEGKKNNEGNFLFELSDINYFISNYTGKYNMFTVSFEYNLYSFETKRRWIKICDILRKNVIKECEIIKNEKDLPLLNLQILGCKKTLCKIFKKSYPSMVLLVENYCVKNGDNYIEGLNFNDCYKIDFFQESVDEFGFSNIVEYISTRYNVGYVDMGKLENCEVDIVELFYKGDKLKLSTKHQFCYIKKLYNNVYTANLKYIDRQENRSIKYPFKFSLKYEGGNIYLNSANIEGNNVDIIYNKHTQCIVSYEDKIFDTMSNREFDEKFEILEQMDIKITMKIRRIK